MGKIVIATLGSLGDLLPYLAIAECLRERGREVLIAAPMSYRELVESRGLSHASLRPDYLTGDTPSIVSRFFANRYGVRFLLQDVVLASLRETWRDLTAIVTPDDALISHPLVYAAPICEVAPGSWTVLDGD